VSIFDEVKDTIKRGKYKINSNLFWQLFTFSSLDKDLPESNHIKKAMEQELYHTCQLLLPQSLQSRWGTVFCVCLYLCGWTVLFVCPFGRNVSICLQK